MQIIVSSNDMSSRSCFTSFCDPVAILSDTVSELDARIIQGYCTLTVLASQRGFSIQDASIQDVPADGDCLFFAISFQLESVGIQPPESNELRHHIWSKIQQLMRIYITELFFQNYNLMKIS